MIECRGWTAGARVDSGHHHRRYRSLRRIDDGTGRCCFGWALARCTSANSAGGRSRGTTRVAGRRTKRITDNAARIAAFDCYSATFLFQGLLKV